MSEPSAVPESGSQAVFEGLDVSGMSQSLKSTANLPCPRALAIGDEVKGYVDGVVTAVLHSRNKDGVLVRHHVVEVVRFLSEA